MKRIWRIALLTGAAFAVPAALNAVVARGRRELKSALPGESGEYAWPMAPIFYSARGVGEPVVFVHGIGAGESAFEWRHNFDVIAEAGYRAVAPDLPGFGRSAHPHLTYTADLYVLALVDFLRDVVREPAHIVASSLSAAYAVRVASLRPEMVRSLTLVCPTGLEALRGRAPVAGAAAYGAFSLPAIGGALYNGIASYAYIEKYLREGVYADPLRVTPALVEHYYQAAHRPNSLYALRSFVSGLLALDIRADWPELAVPTFVAWGREAKPTPVEQAQAFVRQNPRACLRVFERSGLLPHDEEAEDFNDALLTFLQAQEGRGGADRLPPAPRREAVPGAPPPDSPVALSG